MTTSPLEESIIYVRVSKTRRIILQQLQRETEYISTSRLADITGSRRSGINHHCKGLAKRELIERKSIEGVKGMQMKITEKGIKVTKEINRRESSQRTDKEVNM